MTVYSSFWLTLGWGIAIPFTLIVLFNIFLSVTKGDSYQLDLKKLAVLYTIALFGWALIVGVR